MPTCEKCGKSFAYPEYVEVRATDYRIGVAGGFGTVKRLVPVCPHCKQNLN